MDFSIRKATINDLPSIMRLVGELAEFEKEPDKFIATLADFQAGFEIVYNSWVAIIDDTIIGMIIYNMAFSTWKGKMLYLEDFYVSPSYRGLGIGKALFDQYIDTGKALNCKVLKWQVLDWNIEALDFYKKYDAEIEKCWWNGKLFLD